MRTLLTRLEKIETALRETQADENAWFEIVKENGIERAQAILAERGMTAELAELRGLMADARAEVEQWERETFDTLSADNAARTPAPPVSPRGEADGVHPKEL